MIRKATDQSVFSVLRTLCADAGCRYSNKQIFDEMVQRFDSPRMRMACFVQYADMLNGMNAREADSWQHHTVPAFAR